MADNIAISAGLKNKRSLWIAFLLTSNYMIAEAVGGILTGSLALLADAGHMLTDAGALGLALFAIRYAERPASPQKTYGFLRTEILAALANSLALLLVSGYILYEAWSRFREPPEVQGAPMMIVATIGLVLNFVSMRMLASAAGESLNAKGAYLEVLSDTLGSVGVIVAGVIVMTTGWNLADPIIGAGIGLFIVPRTWTLLKDSVHILLEGTPARIDLAALETAVKSVKGVILIHDTHVWTLTSGWDALSAHVTVEDGAWQPRILTELQALLITDFQIEHVTLQLEEKDRPPERWSV